MPSASMASVTVTSPSVTTMGPSAKGPASAASIAHTNRCGSAKPAVRARFSTPMRTAVRSLSWRWLPNLAAPRSNSRSTP